jgi:hypothetical protein
MDGGSGGERLSLLDRRLAPAFRLWSVAVAPGRELAFDQPCGAARSSSSSAASSSSIVSTAGASASAAATSCA